MCNVRMVWIECDVMLVGCWVEQNGWVCSNCAASTTTAAVTSTQCWCVVLCDAGSLCVDWCPQNDWCCQTGDATDADNTGGCVGGLDEPCCWW